MQGVSQVKAPEESFVEDNINAEGQVRPVHIDIIVCSIRFIIRK